MATAKDIILRPIAAGEANALVKRVHYSGKVVQNSQLHIGVFLHGKLEGAMQFGPSLDKRKIQGLVTGTQWHEFIELNRMAFSEALPRNSESRAIAVAMRLLRQHAPQLKWVISFADAAQCGDGAIYRAAGFVLTAIKDSVGNYYLPSQRQIMEHEDYNHNDPRWRALADYAGQYRTIHVIFVQAGNRQSANQKLIKSLFHEKLCGRQGMGDFVDYIGGTTVDGYQLRYIYFIDPSYRARLTVPELPYSEIDRLGAGMYRGEKRSQAGEATSVAPDDQSGQGGATPTHPLHNSPVKID